jgi:hypothetical protein
MKFLVNMGKIIIGQIYTNETRPQKVEITDVQLNEVEYKVIEATTKNIISYFVCTKDRFLRLYRL